MIKGGAAVLKPINIGICDDESIQVELFFKYVENWAIKNNRKVNIETFNSAESFHFKWLENKTYDILLLDIEMPGQNGVELAKTIRKKDKDINIIFITARSEFIAEGYEVEAINYLLKPLSEDRLYKCLDRAVEKIPEKETRILVDIEGETVSIKEKDILFLESLAHNIEIQTRNKTYNTRMNLSDIEKDLNQDAFIKNHRSYIVNLLHIKRIGKEEIELDNGDNIPMSRRRYKDVNMKFIKFFRGERDEW